LETGAENVTSIGRIVFSAVSMMSLRYASE